jgi:GAF domain-containing protein
LEVARRAVALVVPSLAEGGVLDVKADGGVTRIALAHLTVEGRDILERATKAHPPTLGSQHLTVHVMTRGDSIVIPEVSNETVARYGLDADEAKTFRSIGARSAMAAPLEASGRIIGALAVTSATRRYCNDDLTLFEELARRVGSALENARLDESTRAAVRARDEFISMAAHELNTPLTTLQLESVMLVRRSQSCTACPEIAASAEAIQRQVKRLLQVVEQMLDGLRDSQR